MEQIMDKSKEIFFPEFRDSEILKLPKLPEKLPSIKHKYKRIKTLTSNREPELLQTFEKTESVKKRRIINQKKVDNDYLFFYE